MIKTIETRDGEVSDSLDPLSSVGVMGVSASQESFTSWAIPYPEWGKKVLLPWDAVNGAEASPRQQWMDWTSPPA